ncbi:MAG: hypothetical protein ABIL09_30250 [Gemmatimonadota bacterium]
MAAAVVGLVVPGGPSTALAHLPEGLVLPAFQFPDHLVPVIDGRLEDWDLVGPAYEVNEGQLIDLVAGAPARPADFRARLMIGWCESRNRLYVAAEVADDVHQVDRPAGSAATLIWQDDDLEFMVDPDHSGGQYARFDDLPPDVAVARNGADASHFILAGPHPDGDYFVNFSAAEWYALPQGPYTAAALTSSGGVTRYEMSLAPFDQVSTVADFLSRPHDLAEGQILGLNIECRDFDASPTVWEAVWSLSGGQNAIFLSERFADVRLMPLDDAYRPTAIEARTWGRIKASFRN